MITKVTITGADDSINATDLVQLSKEFPFVEWGILVSQKRFGTPRYPSTQWIRSLHEHYVDSMELSCHLCGYYVREFAKGNRVVAKDLGSHWNMFDRVQLNFHAIPHEQSESLSDNIAWYSERQFIFQFDGVNEHLIKQAAHNGLNVAALFDKSGGKGILPKEKEGWPDYSQNYPCGYAGGLSPDNVREQIKLIEAKAGLMRTWIDVETHVRSNFDHQFDLEKVRAFLQACRESVPGL